VLEVVRLERIAGEVLEALVRGPVDLHRAGP
jgi:hypothetical protein